MVTKKKCNNRKKGIVAMVEKKKHPIKTSKKGFLSLFSSSKIESTSKDTTTTSIENQANPETTKYITKDFVENPTYVKNYYEQINYISALSRTCEDSLYSSRNDNGPSYSTKKT